MLFRHKNKKRQSDSIEDRTLAPVPPRFLLPEAPVPEPPKIAFPKSRPDDFLPPSRAPIPAAATTLPEPQLDELEPDSSALSDDELLEAAFDLSTELLSGPSEPQSIAAFDASTPAVPINPINPTNSTNSISSINPISTPSTATSPAPLRSARQYSAPAPYTGGPVRSLTDLLRALKNHQPRITLGADIITPQNLLIDHNVLIDFNGHSIISEQTTPDAKVLDIRCGETTLTGSGNIFAMGPGSIAIRVSGAISSGIPRYTSVSVESNLHLYAPEGTGLEISANRGAAYGVLVDFSGEIIAHTGLHLSGEVRGLESPAPAIRLKNGARIIADETGGRAVEALGLGNWKIDSAELYAGTTLFAKSGTLRLSGSRMISTSNTIELATGPGDHLDLQIDSGAYASEQGLTFYGYPVGVDRLVVRDGEFCGIAGVVNPELAAILEAEGGDFESDLETFMYKLRVAAMSTPVLTAATDELELSDDELNELFYSTPAPVSTHARFRRTRVAASSSERQPISAALSAAGPLFDEGPLCSPKPLIEEETLMPGLFESLINGFQAGIMAFRKTRQGLEV